MREEKKRKKERKQSKGKKERNEREEGSKAKERKGKSKERGGKGISNGNPNCDLYSKEEENNYIWGKMLIQFKNQTFTRLLTTI